MNEMVRSRSKEAKRTHWWNWMSSRSMVLARNPPSNFFVVEKDWSRLPHKPIRIYYGFFFFEYQQAMREGWEGKKTNSEWGMCGGNGMRAKKKRKTKKPILREEYMEEWDASKQKKRKKKKNHDSRLDDHWARASRSAFPKENIASSRCPQFRNGSPIRCSKSFFYFWGREDARVWAYKPSSTQFFKKQGEKKEGALGEEKNFLFFFLHCLWGRFLTISMRT